MKGDLWGRARNPGLTLLVTLAWLAAYPGLAAPPELFDRATLSAQSLPNGLKVVVKEDRSARLVSICIAVGVGSRNEVVANNGISHLVEHMMFKGSRNYPPRTLRSAIEGMGGELNGATTRDNTYFYATIPSDQFPAALDGLADTIIAPTFPEDQIDSERVVVAIEIGGARDRAADVARDLLFHLAYETHPYRLPIAGTLQALLGLRREDLIAWHHRWYTADNMAVVIAGDVSPTQAIERVAAAFADLKPSEATTEAIPPEPEPTARRESRQTYDIADGHVRFGFRTPGFDDFKANCALDVLLFMLGKGYSSRLRVTIQDRQALASAVGTNYVTQRDPSLFEVWAVCAPDRVGAVRAAVMRQLADLAGRPASAAELTRAKRMLEGRFLMGNELLSQQARTLATYAISGDPFRIADYLPTVRGLSGEDVAGIASRYLDVERCTILILEPRTNTQDGGAGGAAPT